MRNWHLWPMVIEAASAAPVYSLAAHMAQKIPVPANQWLRWLVDGLQFYFANNEKREDIAIANAQDARAQR